MSLKLRPTGLASPVDKDRGDYTLFSGEWAMGRIYEERGSPQHLRWYWSLHGILGNHSTCAPMDAGQRLRPLKRSSRPVGGNGSPGQG
jgi:hypothetical protein